jgi:PAS domain S-box-containing protein
MVALASICVLLIETPGGGVVQALRDLPATDLRVFRSDQPPELLQELLSADPAASVVVLDATPAALSVARVIHASSPGLQFVFLARGDVAAFQGRLRASFLARAKCSVLDATADDFPGELHESIKAAARQQRHRAAISQVNRQLDLQRAEQAKASRHLVIARRFLASIVEHSADSIITLSSEHTVLGWNAACERLWSCPGSDAIGRPFETFITPGAARRFAEAVRRVVEHGNAVRVELDLPVGTPPPTVEATLAPVRDENGVISAFALVARDITARKYSELNLRNQKTALEGIVHGWPLAKILTSITHWVEESIPRPCIASVLLLDPDGRRLKVGAGQRVPETWSRFIDGLSVGPDAGACGTAVFRKRRVIVEDVATDPLWNGYRDEALRQGLRSCWSTPIMASSGKVLGTFAIYYPQTSVPTPDEIDIVDVVAQTAAIAIERKMTEDELAASQRALEAHARDLEERVAERTATLQEALSELEAFSYSVSHDLRAPLRAMETYAQMLKDDYGEDMPDEARRYTERIMANAAKMDRLMQDVLAFSRVSRAGIAKTLINMDALLETVIEQNPDLLEARERILIATPLGDVVGHEPSLVQCLSNLLQNALKFVPKDRVPEIRVFSETRGERVRLTVCDNGIGISPEHQGRIFGIFERAGPSSIGGTGIGLAIVKRAVERMGGGTGVDSQLGKGACFWIELPQPNPATLPLN